MFAVGNHIEWNGGKNCMEHTKTLFGGSQDSTNGVGRGSVLDDAGIK